MEYCRGCVWGFLGERDEYSLAVFGGVCGEGFGQLVEWVLQVTHAERSWRHSPNWGPQCFAVSLTIRLNGSYPVAKVATLVNDCGKPLLTGRVACGKTRYARKYTDNFKNTNIDAPKHYDPLSIACCQSLAQCWSLKPSLARNIQPSSVNAHEHGGGAGLAKLICKKVVNPHKHRMHLMMATPQ